MTSKIPSVSNFPSEFDNDNNLFLVHDALRVRLLDDYKPGDTSVLIEGDEETISRFPATGIITLTEQCSEIDKRALSFYYNSKTSTSFDELEILPEFQHLDSIKFKKITNVTMNVLDKHHNHLKDSLIAVENFLGTKYTKDKKTITGRLKNLNNLIFKPKVWFSVDKDVGLLDSSNSFTVNFLNESFRLGEGWVRQTWSFGEEGVSNTVFFTNNNEEYESIEETNGSVKIKGAKVTKTYTSPGVYSVKLHVENEYGSNEIEFKDLIKVKIECPEPANIIINHRSSQTILGTNPPIVRSIANSFIDLEVSSVDSTSSNYSAGGELLNSSGSPIDPIEEYTWNLGDDLPHNNSKSTRAMYSIGGYYDIILRVDTKYGAYRITKYENSIDVIENTNLWLFNFSNKLNDGSGSVKSFEFGLISETFKLLGNTSLSVNRSNQFLYNSPLSYQSDDYYEGTIDRAKKEFDRNVEFAPVGTTSSGNKGNSLLFWSSGGSTTDQKNILVKKYNAFDDHYENLSSITNRPWNWAALSSLEKTYFIFGQDEIITGQNQAFSKKTDYDLSTQTFNSPVNLNSNFFENGSDDLLSHPSFFDDDGLATSGYFATYKTAWKDSTGYLLRNSSVNEFYRIGDFYKTKGSISSPFSSITKLPSIVGSVKVEGQLVNLSNGVFMFNNSGEVCAWNDTSLTWEVGRANSSSLTFRSLQDTNISSFDDKSNTLLATSDSDRVAYLSYDYSDKAFIKFNGTDLTFSKAKTARPSGFQFKMGVC